MRSRLLAFSALLLALTTTGCGAHSLIASPNLYVNSAENPFEDVPEVFQSNSVDVLYATDRRPIHKEGEPLAYDHGRSPSLAFGSATVTFGDEVSWDDLVQASRVRDRDISLPVRLTNIEEQGRFPRTPYGLVESEESTEVDGLMTDPAVLEQYGQTREALHEELRRRLAKTPRKEVFVYVHGYNNSFEDAVTVMAELWHFLPRTGVPIAYTWPAGIGGLRGYFYDRESGEFTIYHLKDFLMNLVACEEVEKVHLIAHSRGTDVLMTALRELWIEKRGREGVESRATKLGKVIIAAPDLDLEVIQQRVVAEEVPRQIDSLSIYMSKTDLAIGFSTWLFVSDKRMGKVDETDIDATMIKRGALIAKQGAKQGRELSLIKADITTGWIGHSYFYSHPAVLSDLILILRDGMLAGAEHGRPLGEGKGNNFWSIYDEYPEPRPRD